MAEAVASPTNSPPLRDLAGPGDKVCIVFTDITRASPDHLLVLPVLAELEAAGVRDEDITLLCGIGMHRPSTPEEKVAKLGQAVVDRYRVIDNEPLNPDALVDLGTTDSGIPLSVNKVAYEADLLIATGIVEPHQYAGYSGGRKTLAVGAAGEAMIAYTHGPHMVDHPGTRLGRIEGNPFHEAITEAARRAGLRFIVNVVQDDQKRVVYVRAGEPEATFEELVAIAKTIYEVPVPQQYDVAVAGVGFPKDANLYQASRAASYLFFAPAPVVKPGGVFIITRALWRRRRRWGRRAAISQGDAGRARRADHPGRCPPARLSAGAATGLCHGQGLGAEQGDHRWRGGPGTDPVGEVPVRSHDGGCLSCRAGNWAMILTC